MMIATSKPQPQPQPPNQIITLSDDDVILPPPPSPPLSIPVFIDLSSSDDEDDLRVLRFKPDQTHFKARRPDPVPPSGSSQPEPDFPSFVCELCADERPSYDSFPVENCRHVYCSACVIAYVTSKLDSNEPSIRCPVPNCAGLLEREYCRSLLPKPLFARWGHAMCEAVVLGDEKFYCPYKDCSAMMINEVGNEYENEEARCPHCGRGLCVKCGVVWHQGMRCEEFRRMSEEEKGSEAVMLRNLAKKEKWTRCPSCRFYVEKSYGCSYMKCRCGYAFCYNCGVQALTHTSSCRSCRK